MLAGFLIAVPMLLTAYAAQTDRLPHKIVLIAVVTVVIYGIMVSFDELGPERILVGVGKVQWAAQESACGHVCPPHPNLECCWLRVSFSGSGAVASLGCDAALSTPIYSCASRAPP
jgi:hypothetical protein